MEKANRFVGKCIATAVITTRNRSFVDPTDFNKPRGDKKSLDGKLTCKDVGAEAQDYDACVAAMVTYDLGLTEEKLSEEVYRKDIAVIKSTELATQDPNDPAAALRSQVKVLERTVSHYEYKVAAETAKGVILGVMAGIHGGINVKTDCVETVKPVFIAAGFAGGEGFLDKRYFQEILTN